MGNNKVKKYLDEKVIKQLDNNKFEIPEYQRGYRWEEEQVREMLEDIWKSFNESKGKKYYIQPIIVKRKEDQTYLLVDGQQRLTTIYMILTYIDKKFFKSNNNDVKCYSIKYCYLENEDSSSLEIDEKINEYLNSSEKTLKYKNLNDYYYEIALREIDEWFKNNLEGIENEHDEIKNFFNYIRDQVTVMWYELDEEDDDKKAFLRVNSGKISLTTSDLVKAEFLKSSNDLDMIKKIAREWNEIEEKIYDNDFWYFISNKVTDDRMTELLKLINDNSENIHDYYQSKIESINKEEKNLEKIWKNEIKNIFQIFIEWYENDEIYNYIGFLIKGGNKDNKSIIKDLKDKYLQGKELDEFIGFLKNEIGKMLNAILKIGKNIDTEKITRDEFKRNIENLTYLDDKQNIMKILLLYNILETNNSKESQRFPFDKYFVNKEEREEKKLEGIKERKIEWSLEHISSQHENTNIEDLKDFQSLVDYLNLTNKNQLEGLPKEEDWKKNKNDIEKKLKEILKDFQSFVDYLNLTNKNQLEGLPKKEDWKKNKNDIEKKLKEIFDKNSINKMHGIGNLALLESNLNSSNGNNFFIKKRNNIIKNSRENYIPICTMKVFLKMFYNESNELKKQQFIEWDEDDYNIYENNIIDTIYDSIYKKG